MDQMELQKNYEQALKLGKQAWNQKVLKGESGYLRTLDSMLQKGDIVTEYPLGIVEIPIHKIVGTYTHSRSVSFADNYMPIMDPKSEFALKWMHLYDYHIENGIADPIKVYEYLNRFFVIEGNKRVSVLKFVNGTTINGQVIRLIPKRNPEDKTNTIYYEYINFYKETKINSIWFTEVGRFTELLEYIKQYRQMIQNEDSDKLFLSNCYRPFRQIYHEFLDTKLEITTGDAFLTFLKIYGLPKEITAEKNRNQIRNVVNELKVIDLDENYVETDIMQVARRKRVFSSLTELVIPKKIIKIAFVYAKSSNSSGWTYAHELGRLHIENIFKGQIKTQKIENIPENELAYKTFKNLAESGIDVIFSTSPTFLAPALKAAMEYHHIKFFQCAATHSYKSLTLYYGRIHEPRYILGMIAGAMTQTNIIGYVAPYPISEVVSSINAFTLGALAVNPYVKVKALWTNHWDNPKESKKVARTLQDLGADIISNENLPIPGDITKEYGVYRIHHESGEKTHYAMAIWNWGLFYEQVIQNILNGSLKTMSDNDVPINFWQGLNNGIVDVLYSNRNMNSPMKNLIESVKQSIVNNEFNIFQGPIRDQNGVLKAKPGELLDYEQIIHMDWLIEGVEGVIPDIKTLTPIDPFSYMQGLNI
ncbi:MAG: BMP family ABC transporter substrate-binding protein [Candidatus Cellulosilyticum pullistercoris]|uniref:BMP family ABC transporter substrate-binding protein n=1 Tax=Candidatus Cellulosilyticum pullistercoris TaxID=2838521 RepID=A0A9E2NNE6_9FIRM|nr:BMP family ABC transporter substrate-binding protein [Candidatus Cellulosilyticum pullistercoris]